MSDVVMEPYPTSLNLIRAVTDQSYIIKTLIAKLHARTLKLRTQDIGQTSGHWQTITSKAASQRPLLTLSDHADNVTSLPSTEPPPTPPNQSPNLSKIKQAEVTNSPEPDPELHPKHGVSGEDVL